MSATTTDVKTYDVRMTTSDGERVTERVTAPDPVDARAQARGRRPDAEITRVRVVASGPVSLVDDPPAEPDVVESPEQPVDESEISDAEIVEPEQSSESTPEPQPPAPSDEPVLSDDERLKAVLKRAQMSTSSELSAERRERALSAPDTMGADALRNYIMRGSASDNGNGGRERSPEHADLAKAATALVRSNSPARAAISTRAAAATVQHVGRKDWHKLLGGITDEHAKQFATGAIKFAALSEDVKTQTREVVKQIGEAAQLKRFEARELAAILVAKSN